MAISLKLIEPVFYKPVIVAPIIIRDSSMLKYIIYIKRVPMKKNIIWILSILISMYLSTKILARETTEAIKSTKELTPESLEKQAGNYIHRLGFFLGGSTYFQKSGETTATIGLNYEFRLPYLERSFGAGAIADYIKVYQHNPYYNVNRYYKNTCNPMSDKATYHYSIAITAYFYPFESMLPIPFKFFDMKIFRSLAVFAGPAAVYKPGYLNFQAAYIGICHHINLMAIPQIGNLGLFPSVTWNIFPEKAALTYGLSAGIFL